MRAWLVSQGRFVHNRDELGACLWKPFLSSLELISWYYKLVQLFFFEIMEKKMETTIMERKWKLL